MKNFENIKSSINWKIIKGNIITNNVVVNFNLLMLLSSIIFIQRFNFFILLFLTISSILILLYANVKIVKIALPLIIVILLTLFLIPKDFNLSFIWNKLNDSLNGYSLRDLMINYIKSNYSSDSSVFLSMMILNDKQYNTEIMQLLTRLNLVHLFIISGMHISLINGIIRKLIKNEKINTSINFVINIFLFYITAFSLSILRVIINLIIKTILKNKLDNFNSNCITGIIVIIFFIRDAQSYSFILIMITSLFVSYVSIRIKNKFLKATLITCFTNISIIPITISFNGEINLLSFLNSFLFNNIIIIIYFFELIFCWFPFLFNLNDSFIRLIIKFFRLLLQNEATINFNIDSYSIFIFYLISFNFLNYLEIKQLISNKCNINYNKVYGKLY